MDRRIAGLHHVTVIAGDAQQNLDFYTGILGLRLVKKTVNFDDPGAYHLYYGDELGRPGAILTFFPVAGARQGQRGTGQTTAIAFAVPRDSLAYWAQRLQNDGLAGVGRETRFGDEALLLADPDGLALELVADPADGRHGWDGGTVPAEHAIRGLHGVTLAVRDPGPTEGLLTETLGFQRMEEERGRVRYAIRGGEAASIDLVALPTAPAGVMGAGSVHHIAWRTAGVEEQADWRRELAARGHDVTGVRDRQYFHSIYFHEPGGVLCEIATDRPGFTVDETPADLGTGLKLPPWLEPYRATLEQALPPLRLAVVTEEPSHGHDRAWL